MWLQIYLWCGRPLPNSVFSKKMRFAVHLPVFSELKCALGSQAIVNSHVMRPAAPWFLMFFPRKTRLRMDSSPSLPLQIFIRVRARRKARCWQRSNVCKVDVGLFDFQVFSTMRVALRRKGDAVISLENAVISLENACHSAQKGCDVKGGIPQNAWWWRTWWNTIRPSQKRRPFNYVRQNAMKLSLACAQCSVAAWKRKQSSTRRVFTYVMGGRVGVNDICELFARFVKSGPHPTPSVMYSINFMTQKCQATLTSHPTLTHKHAPWVKKAKNTP